MFKLLVTASLITLTFGGVLNFWPKFDGRIINGENTTIEEFPYQVSFQYLGEHNCGGSILDKWTILTAAHCTNDFHVDKMSVRAGSSKQADGGQLIRVAEVIQHEQFDPFTQDHDISLLKLVSPLKFGPGVAPIPLQELGAEVSPGTAAVITGWGDLKEDGDIFPEVLQKVYVDVISNAECSRYYSQEADITEDMLCCYTKGKDSCQGDSGGPLVANGKQIGVVSWGIGCANPKYPGVYCKVSELRSWIDSHK